MTGSTLTLERCVEQMFRLPRIDGTNGARERRESSCISTSPRNRGLEKTEEEKKDTTRLTQGEHTPLRTILPSPFWTRFHPFSHHLISSLSLSERRLHLHWRGQGSGVASGMSIGEEAVVVGCVMAKCIMMV